MEFTELADYPLPAGVLTEWTPRIDDDSAGWQTDDRPLAYTHEAHCRHSIDAGRNPQSSAAWIGAAFRVPDTFDPAAVRRALRSWNSRHETFRTTVVAESDGRLGRRTVPGHAVDVTAHVHGDILTGTAIHDHLAHFFGTRLSPFRWPHCLVATVHAPDDDGFLLVFGADHSVMDAYSMLLAVSELRRLYEYELRGTDPHLAEIGSHVDFSALDRRLGDALTSDHPAVRLWSNFLHADSADGPRFPDFPLPLTSDATASPRQSSLSSWLLSDFQTDRLGRRCRENGHGLQSGVLAALAITARSLTGDETVRFAMPMHTRFEPCYAQSVGWYVGLVPIEIDLEGADTFDRCLVPAAAAVDRTKGMARLPYSKIADILQVTSTPRFVVSYLDLRHTPDASNWSSWQARTLRGSTESADEVYFWILRTPLGLNVSARFPSHEAATTNVHRFVAALSSNLAHLAEGSVAGSTGSDLELSAR